MNVDPKSLIPAIVSLILFVATTFGKHLDELNVTQLVTAVITLVGVILGILANHKKPPSSPQPPAQP